MPNFRTPPGRKVTRSEKRLNALVFVLSFHFKTLTLLFLFFFLGGGVFHWNTLYSIYTDFELNIYHGTGKNSLWWWWVA